MKHALAAFALSVPVAFALAFPASAQGATETATVISGGKSHAFTVEIANTKAAADQGLIGRASLPNDHGLLIDYRPVGQPATPTMKGVTIGLDLLFIAPDGTITGIIQYARPGSLRPLWTGLGWVVTMEIPAGQVAARGIKPGDKVKAKAFGNAG
jgi:uncharacterized protein